MAFPALSGYYKLLFLYLEPASTMYPAFWTWVFPGAKNFHDELIPNSAPSGPLDPRTTLAIMQLGNTYLLLSLLSSLVFRAVRDAVPNNPVAQDKIIGAALIALAIADATHIAITFIGLPSEIQFAPAAWNSMTHGNITFVVLLLISRVAWFNGIGRKAYYYGRFKKSQRG
jgi:hypothetical protein